MTAETPRPPKDSLYSLQPTMPSSVLILRKSRFRQPASAWSDSIVVIFMPGRLPNRPTPRQPCPHRLPPPPPEPPPSPRGGEGRGGGRFRKRARLVSVVIRLVGPRLLHGDVAGLRVGQLGEVRVQLSELQPRHLLVEMLGQDVDADLVLVRVGVQLDLRDDLVGERRAHDVAGVPGGAAQVDQPSLREQDDALAVGEDDVVDLRLDVLPPVLLERGDVDVAVAWGEE